MTTTPAVPGPSQEAAVVDITSLFLENAFTFHIGPEKKVVKIPPSLLTKHSAPLKAMISNGMKETKKRVAVLPDEEAETIEYFMEWALTGMYRVADTNDDSDFEQQKLGNVSHYYCHKCKKFAVTPTQVNIGLWCSTCKISNSSRCSRCSRALVTRTSYETECTSGDCNMKVLAGAWKESDNVQVRNYFKNSFAAEESPVGSHKHNVIHAFIENSLIKIPTTGNLLAHAKVYVFAKKYLITDLSDMAIHLLHRELSRYTADKVGSGSLVRMIEYAYQNTGDFDGTNSVNKLKVIGLKYAAINSDKLLRCKGFCDLLRGGGEFGVDFARMLSKQVF